MTFDNSYQVWAKTSRYFCELNLRAEFENNGKFRSLSFYYTSLFLLISCSCSFSFYSWRINKCRCLLSRLFLFIIAWAFCLITAIVIIYIFIVYRNESKMKRKLRENVSEIKDLGNACILIQIWSKSDEL